MSAICTVKNGLKPVNAVLLLVVLTVAPLTAVNFNQETAVEAVRDGFLDLNAGRTIEATVSLNPWLERRRWAAEPQGGNMQVSLTLWWKDAQVRTAFTRDNQYKWKLSFKAMQLAPAYGLISDRDAVKTTILFELRPDGSFAVKSGLIAVRQTKDGSWREKALSDKALLCYLQGLYARENPLNSLVRGLPYK